MKNKPLKIHHDDNPQPVKHAGRPCKYKWAEMDINDFFIVERDMKYGSREKTDSWHGMRVQAANAGRRLKVKFSCTASPEGLKVMRVS